MRAHALCVTFAAVVAAACGGSSSSPAAAPPPSAGPEPTGNPTTSSPSPSPAPPPPGSPSPSPSPSPTPSPSSQPDRFVDIERLDSNAECDALVPSSVPAPVTATATPSTNPGGCGRGLSEGTGHVGAIVQFGRGNQWQVFAPDGHAEQQLGLTSDLWPQPEGWLGVQASTTGVPAFANLLAFFPDGTPRRSEQPQPGAFSPRVVNVAPDPLGGAALVLWGPTGTGGCLGDLRRFDATGAPAGTPAQVGCNIGGLGVSTGGEALVLEGAGTGAMLVRWIRRDGTPAVPAAADPNAFGGQLFPLLDGSLALQQGAVYVRRYPHLSTASQAAPPWLSARTNQGFRFTMSNKGYAFFPPAGQNSSDCTQAVELVAPSGRRCTKLTFRRDGNACQTGSIDQGWDGTVVQQTSSGACGWRFWPALLRGG